MRHQIRNFGALTTLFLSLACGGGSPTAPSSTSPTPVAAPAPAPAPAQPTTMTLGLRFTPVAAASAQDVTLSGIEERRGVTINADITAQNGDLNLSKINCTGTRGTDAFVVEMVNTPMLLSAGRLQTIQRPVTLVTEFPVKIVPVQFSCQAEGSTTSGVPVVVNKVETVPPDLIPPTAFAPCVESDFTACLQNGEFEVAVTFESAPGVPARDARVMAGTRRPDSGTFVFEVLNRPEMSVQVVDTCAANNTLEVRVGGATPWKFDATVKQVKKGKRVKYTNGHGREAREVRDRSSFSCPVPPA